MSLCVCLWACVFVHGWYCVRLAGVCDRKEREQSEAFSFETVCACVCVRACVYACVSCVSLQGSIDERLKQLQDAHRDFGPGSQHFLSSKRSLLLSEVTTSCRCNLCCIV